MNPVIKKFEYMIQVYEEYQDEIKEFVIDKIEGHTGVDVPAELEGFVVLTSLAVLYFVSRYAYDKVSGGKKDGQPSINNSYNNTITVLGDMTGVSIGEVDKAIQAAIPKPRRKFLTQKVADIFRPARADAGSTIAVGGDKIVGSKEIYEFPTDAEIMGIVDSHTINEDNLLIEIRATDKDRNKSGWGAQIVGNAKYPKRLPMDLYPDLNAADLASKNQVFGDMVIDVSVDFEGNIKPKKIHLLRYRDVSKDAT